MTAEEAIAILTAELPGVTKWRRIHERYAEVDLWLEDAGHAWDVQYCGGEWSVSGYDTGDCLPGSSDLRTAIAAAKAAVRDEAMMMLRDIGEAP